MQYPSARSAHILNPYVWVCRKNGSDAPTVSKLRQERVTIVIGRASSDPVCNCTLKSGWMDAKLREKMLCFIMTCCIAHFPLAQVRNFKSEYSYLGLTNRFTIQAICFTTCWSKKPPRSKKSFLWAELHFHQSLCRSRLALVEVKAITSTGVSSQTFHPEVRSPVPAARHSWTPACPMPGHPEGFPQSHPAPSRILASGHLWQRYRLLQLQHKLSRL